MRRTNIYLTDRQLKALGAEADKLQIAVAELVRRIIDAHLEQKGNK